MKHYFYIFVTVLLLAVCTSGAAAKEYVIGMSQCMLDDAWRQSMLRDAEIELSNYDNVRLVLRDANSSNERQIKQIEELIAMGVDVLIISPFESEPITEIAEKAYQTGIPTIITDRRIQSDQYTTFIGGENYQIGVAAGEYAAHLLPRTGARILEIWGLPSSSPAQERHAGFIDALHNAKVEYIIDSIEANWRYDTAKVAIQAVQNSEQYDLVYSHNDMMAIAAREYMNERRESKNAEVIPILGVDAVPGAGLEAVADGRISASFLYPTGGAEVIRTAMQILRGDSVSKEIALSTMPIEKDAAKSLIMQNKRLLDYQQSITHQKAKIDTLSERYMFLRSSLATIVALLIVIILVLVAFLWMYHQLKKSHRQLAALNEEIEKATTQKIQFFMNISHEIRTPLTLIMGPLTKLLHLENKPALLEELHLIDRNAKRLLREVNQMLDFRKIEATGVTLTPQDVAIVSLVEDASCYFIGEAQERHIHFAVTTDNQSPILVLDAEKMEKVLVNLISNAFKFTPENGMIRIHTEDLGASIRISVSNSGKGIAENDLPHIFDRFYSKKDSKISSTGIGLHLVKEYVKLHNGTVDVTSSMGQLTTFTIVLPKENGLVATAPTLAEGYGLSVETDALLQNMLQERVDATLLVVEDDEDIRQYLVRELSANFTVFTATNGKEALAHIENQEVSLIVSDVMMPKMNGFELCHAVKNNINFSHIPIILLTALSNERQQLYGTATGADDYIAKPFNSDFLRLKIMRLLEQQKQVAANLLKRNANHLFALPTAEKDIDSLPIESLDDLFLRKLLQRIQEIYTDSEYNIERLSDDMAMSRGHFYRKVKALTGHTPVDFVRQYRLNRASELLLQKQYAISEIAYMTGFSSPAYFTKCFKAQFSCTPGDYKG